jgi:16S rRNA U516 pseudouridylate synthase RsuA-like enzyme
MVEALDARVLKLVRVRIGSIAIGTLPIGKWRQLTRAEVAALAGVNVAADKGGRRSSR